VGKKGKKSEGAFGCQVGSPSKDKLKGFSPGIAEGKKNKKHKKKTKKKKKKKQKKKKKKKKKKKNKTKKKKAIS